MTAGAPPPELLADLTERLKYLSSRLHAERRHSRESWDTCDNETCGGDRELLSQLAGYLPEADPACPLCGRTANEHGSGAADGFKICPLPAWQVPRAADMVAARQSPPPGPRVFGPGSADPATAGVAELVDALGVRWHRIPRGWSAGLPHPYPSGPLIRSWVNMELRWFPFIEVRPDRAGETT